MHPIESVLYGAGVEQLIHRQPFFAPTEQRMVLCEKTVFHSCISRLNMLMFSYQVIWNSGEVSPYFPDEEIHMRRNYVYDSEK
jgi:hypothetical protein